MTDFFITELTLPGVERMTRAIQAVVESGNMAHIKVQPKKETRSLAQNRLYWRWVGQIAKQTGHSKRDVADYYQSELLEPVITEFNGKATESIRSTKDLSVEDFSEFLQQFQMMAAESGFQLTSFDDLLKAAMGLR